MVSVLLVDVVRPVSATLRELEREVVSYEVLRDAEDAFVCVDQDDELRVLVLDGGLASPDLPNLIKFTRRRRPDVTVVGQGSGGEHRLFRDLGVITFLRKPWGIFDLESCLRAEGNQGAWACNDLTGERTNARERDEEIRFLARNRIFQVLSREGRRELLARGKLVDLGPGQHLFEQGDLCTSLYVVRSGLIEVLREDDTSPSPTTVALLRSGDMLCELGVLPRTPHRSLARADGMAQVLQIDRESFVLLLEQFPKLAVSMYEVLARRMEAVILHEGGLFSATGELQGSLDWFDLATVLQNVISGESLVGTLLIHNEAGECVARVMVNKGRIVTASIGPMRGEAAFFLLFQVDFTGHRFSFRKQTAITVDPAYDLSDRPSMGLLLDAARIKDESKLVSV
ncbi:MAG: cyclic nucleotide-binding domain-containing protein [Planctomycetota bacterium]